MEEDLIKEKTLEWLTEQSEIELVPQGSLEKEEAEGEQTEQQQDVDAATATVEVVGEEV